MISHFFSWGIFGIVLMAMALVHFFRRQPSFYWLYLIIFLGPLGALIYLAIEWLPELFDPGAFRFVERGRRLREVEADIRQNPSAGNYEELGLLRLDKGDWAGARACFDQRPGAAHRFARSLLPPRPGRSRTGRLCRRPRGPGARGHRRPGLRLPARRRIAGLLPTGRPVTSTAPSAFSKQVLRTSTLTETQLHYAEFLAETGHRAEAKQQALRIRDKRAGMPGFQRRRERKLFRRNGALLRKL